MVRLQRVTVLALHNYLGLTNELFSHVSLSHTHTRHSSPWQSHANICGWCGFALLREMCIISWVHTLFWSWSEDPNVNVTFSTLSSSHSQTNTCTVHHTTHHSPLPYRKCNLLVCRHRLLTQLAPVPSDMANALAVWQCLRSTGRPPLRVKLQVESKNK